MQRLRKQHNRNKTIILLRALSPLPKLTHNSCVSSLRAKMAEQEQLVTKKGKTNSAVWKYFGFKESDVEQKKVPCSRGLAIGVFWRITDGRPGQRHHLSCAARRQRCVCVWADSRATVPMGKVFFGPITTRTDTEVEVSLFKPWGYEENWLQCMRRVWVNGKWSFPWHQGLTLGTIGVVPPFGHYEHLLQPLLHFLCTGVSVIPYLFRFRRPLDQVYFSLFILSSSISRLKTPYTNTIHLCY